MRSHVVYGLKALRRVVSVGATSLLLAQSPVVSADPLGPTVDEAGTTDPFPSPRFGQTVAISGKVAMASIPGDLASEPNEFGRVAVFEETKDGWKRSATLLGSEESRGGFGSAIDIQKNEAVVASSRALYLYERRGGKWVLTAKATLGADAAFGDVAIEHGLIAARVYEPWDGVPMTSVVHVYARKGSHEKHAESNTNKYRVRAPQAVRSLTRVAIIKPQDGSTSTSFGTDLAMDGRLLVVGAPDGDNMSGSAYVYAHLGRHWLQIDRLIANDGTVGDGFGSSVAIRNAVIVVGAPNADLGIPDLGGYGPPRGNVYVFLPYRRGWYQSQQLNSPSDENPIPDLGHEVSIGRNLLAVRLRDTRGLIRGEDSVLVYSWIDRLFQQPEEVASYEGFIPDIDMSGRRLILSRHDAGVFNYYVRGSAHIYVFGRSSPEPQY